MLINPLKDEIVRQHGVRQRNRRVRRPTRVSTSATEADAVGYLGRFGNRQMETEAVGYLKRFGNRLSEEGVRQV